jgi:hypothetical protein
MMATDGLAALPDDARRQAMHYTHVRTHSPNAVQPDQLSREQAWQHILKCYAEAYPSADSTTRSIVSFGLVAKEKHKDADLDADRSEHHHIIVFCVEKHYWRRVRKISASKYNIHLNAVAHDGYSSMFRYLRQATKHKPLHELDPQPFFSDEHPQGDALQNLLKQGEATRHARAARLGLDAKREPDPPVVKTVFGVAFNWVVDHGLRGSIGAVQLQADAASEVKHARPKLLEFVRKHRNDLVDQLAFIWELVEAPKLLERMGTSRKELLFQAATPTTDPTCFTKECANGACKCVEVYESILQFQGVSSINFRHLMYEALTAGRNKGNALMIVGGKDSGKTTVTQPAAKIFKSMPTPQSDSFCPLQNIRGHELFLWQDLRYSPGHPLKEQSGLRIDEGTWNRWLEGLPTLIGVAKTDGTRSDFVYDEDAAFVFTGPFPLTAWRNGVPDEKETEQLTTRLMYVYFNRPAPKREGKGPKPCAFCWSRWILLGELYWLRAQSLPVDDFMSKVAGVLEAAEHSPQLANASIIVQPQPHEPASLMDHLSTLIDWHARGHLNAAEFAAAKMKLGLA